MVRRRSKAKQRNIAEERHFLEGFKLLRFHQSADDHGLR